MEVLLNKNDCIARDGQLTIDGRDDRLSSRVAGLAALPGVMEGHVDGALLDLRVRFLDHLSRLLDGNDFRRLKERVSQLSSGKQSPRQRNIETAETKLPWERCPLGRTVIRTIGSTGLRLLLSSSLSSSSSSLAVISLSSFSFSRWPSRRS